MTLEEAQYAISTGYTLVLEDARDEATDEIIPGKVQLSLSDGSTAYPRTKLGDADKFIEELTTVVASFKAKKVT